MKKLKLLLTGTILGLCIFATPVFANEKANETDYKDHFKTATVTIHEQKHNEETYLKVFDEDNRLLFYTEKCEKTMYVSALSGLNVRTAPTIDAEKTVALPYATKVKVIGNADKGWDIVEIGSARYFVFDKYLSKDKPKNIVSTSTSKKVNKKYVGNGENAAKEEIARRESGGNYNAVSKSGKYIGRYQLTKSYLKGDYSPANQERVADNYVKNRYGSWEKALAHHNKHGWY